MIKPFLFLKYQKHVPFYFSCEDILHAMDGDGVESLPAPWLPIMIRKLDSIVDGARDTGILKNMLREIRRKLTL